MTASLTTSAQFGQRVDGPVTWAGITLQENDTLHFSQGTLTNGQFRFLYDNSGQHIDGSNYNLLIKKFEVRQVNNGQVKNYIILRWPYGIVNAHVSDLSGAINSGELTAANGKVLGKPQAVPSVADELLKLKQLLDGGVLTQQEFDEQKTKLLKQ